MAPYSYTRKLNPFRSSFIVSDSHQVDPNNPPWPAFRGYHEYSFAHATMQSRLPTILGKAIDDTTRTLNDQSSEEQIIDLVQCIERMEKLMVDLSGNSKVGTLRDYRHSSLTLILVETDCR